MINPITLSAMRYQHQSVTGHLIVRMCTGSIFFILVHVKQKTLIASAMFVSGTGDVKYLYPKDYERCSWNQSIGGKKRYMFPVPTTADVNADISSTLLKLYLIPLLATLTRGLIWRLQRKDTLTLVPSVGFRQTPRKYWLAWGKIMMPIVYLMCSIQTFSASDHKVRSQLSVCATNGGTNQAIASIKDEVTLEWKWPGKQQTVEQKISL